jgi:hypothetical protein
VCGFSLSRPESLMLSLASIACLRPFEFVCDVFPDLALFIVGILRAMNYFAWLDSRQRFVENDLLDGWKLTFRRDNRLAFGRFLE